MSGGVGKSVPIRSMPERVPTMRAVALSLLPEGLALRYAAITRIRPFPASLTKTFPVPSTATPMG